MIKSILLTGVGGQGILFAAGIIASAAESAGFNVTTNEIHGMAQRGGSVTAQVRYGEGSFAPLAVSGGIDVIAAMEHIEAVRYAHWLKPGGLAVVAKTSVIPVIPAPRVSRLQRPRAGAGQRPPREHDPDGRALPRAPRDQRRPLARRPPRPRQEGF